MQNQKPQQKQTKHATKHEQQKHGRKMFRLDQRARIVDKRQ